MPALTGPLVDLLWFREIGFQTVFTTELTAKALLFVIGAVVAYFFFTLNARIATEGVSKAPVLWRVSPELPPVDVGRSLSKVKKPLGFFFAFAFGTSAVGAWMKILQFTNSSSFGVTDPIFGREIGYYVFVLPAIASVLGFLRALVILTLIICLILHLLRGRVTLPPQRVGLDSPADKHIAGLLVAFSC